MVLSHQEIDLICDEFGRLWSTADSVPIENFVERHVVVDTELINELILEEVELRHTAGMLPIQEEYELRFPSNLDAVQRAFARLLELDASSQLLTTIDSKQPQLGLSEEAELPERLGRFEIHGRLGAGKFGVVYRGRDTDADRLVALKFPRSVSLNSVQELEQLRNESDLAKHLDHPAIVKSFGLMEEGGFVFLVQQFVAGSTLHAQRQKFDSTESVVQLICVVAEAMAFAHRQGIVHRDLKPANILIDDDGNPLVADFGLSIHESFQRRMRGQLCGTPPYMSPEQVMGLTHQLDGRSDIWSLGVIFYELLTGHRPFHGTTQAELFEEIRLRNEKPLQVHRPDLDRELQRICFKCLSKGVRERYRSADELAEDLRNWLRFRGQWQSGAYVPLVPRGLSAFGPADAEAFVELLPGPRNQLGTPDSVDFWQSRLHSVGGSESVSVGVVFGPTGSGKSSFIRAALIPALDPRMVVAEYVEATGVDTEVRLMKALRRRFAAIPDDVSLPEVFDGLRNNVWSSEQKLLIVLDQFEQWLQHHPQVAESQLTQALRHCNGTNLCCILLIRDEYWLQTSRLFESLDCDLRERENAQRIDRFDKQHARKVLFMLGRALQKLPDDSEQLSKQQDQFLDRVISDLAEEERIASVHLSLFAEMFKHREWTLREFEDIGGVSAVGSKFLEETFGGVGSSPAHRNLEAEVRTVLELLLPDSGSNLKGHMQPVSILREAIVKHHPQTRPDDVLELLSRDLKVIVPTERDYSERRADDKFAAADLNYQLIHDYLVPAIRLWLHRKKQETWRGRAGLRLAELSSEWRHNRDQRYLPSVIDYTMITACSKKRQRTELEAVYLSAAKRFHGIRIGVFVALLAVVIGWFWSAGQKTFRQQARIQVQKYLESPPEAARDNLERLERFSSVFSGIADPERTSENTHRVAVASNHLFAPSSSNTDAIVDRLADTNEREFRFLLSELSEYGDLATEALKQRFRVADCSEERLSLAVAMLYLFETEMPRDEILSNRADPSEATLLTQRLLDRWPSDLRLLELAQRSRSDADLLFTALTAAEKCEITELNEEDRQQWTSLIRAEYLENPDAGVHSACEHLSKTWGIPITDATPTPAPRKGYDWWCVRIADECCMTFVRIGPDQFTRGENSPVEGSLSEYFPVERVVMDQEYWIAQTEATWGLLKLWLAECGPRAKDSTTQREELDITITQRIKDTPNVVSCLELQNDQLPLFAITFEEATELTQWLDASSGVENYVVGIPSSDEWEFACRNGAATLFHFGDMRTEKLLDQYGVLKTRYGADTDHSASLEPVGTKLPARSGLYDMAGNISEFAAPTRRELSINSAERVFLKGGTWEQRGKCSPGAYAATGSQIYHGFCGLRLVLRSQ